MEKTEQTRQCSIYSGKQEGTLFPLTGHTDVIWSVAISPDGESLASASGDGTIKTWRLATCREVQTLTRRFLPARRAPVDKPLPD